MTEVKAMTLNQKQLERLTNMTTYMLLAHFATPKTPSEAAKHMAMAANTVHYHVKRLLELGLLKIVSEQGRKKTYQSVTTHFRVAKQLVPHYDALVPQQTSSILKKLERVFTKTLESQATTGSSLPIDPNDPEFYLLDLHEGFALDSYEPSLSVLELSLSKEQYIKVTTQLAEILNEAKDSVEKGEVCTFTIVSFPGRLTNG